MTEIQVSGAVAEYQGKRFAVLFGGDDWVALRTDRGVALPDAFAYGETTSPESKEYWAKVPMSALGGMVDVVVTGKLSGHMVSLTRRLPDGRVRVEFVGPPAVAQKLGLDGDQYMGWNGSIAPEDLTDVRVQETPRA